MTWEAQAPAVGPIRATGRRRGGSGIVLSIFVVDRHGAWHEVLKVDAFGRAHWHLYTRHHGERVKSLAGPGVLQGGWEVIDHLSEHLADAGYPVAARSMEASHALDTLKKGVAQLVDELRPGSLDPGPG